MPGSFFDTNVHLYLASDDRSKDGRAEDIQRPGGTTSVPVLNEITNVARRKMRLSWTDTHDGMVIEGRLRIVNPFSKAP